jgi:hypothetical protein
VVMVVVVDRGGWWVVGGGPPISTKNFEERGFFIFLSFFLFGSIKPIDTLLKLLYT